MTSRSQTIKQRNLRDKLRYYLLVALILLIPVQMMPVIKDYFYNEVRLVLYIGFGILAFFSVRSFNNITVIPLVRYFVLILSYGFILTLLSVLFWGEITSVFLELLIPFGILLISLKTNINFNSLKKIILIYTIFTLILGITSIFYYGNGFEIAQNYFLEFKNQIGPMIGIGATMMTVLLFKYEILKSQKKSTIILSILILLFIMVIASIRNRASLIGLLTVFIVLGFKHKILKLEIKRLLILTIFSMFLLIGFINGWFTPFLNMLKDSFFSNYNINDLNSISAGRTDTYIEAFKFSLNYPIAGELVQGDIFSSIPHNYILNKWVNYGMVLSVPFVFLYLYLWYFSFHEIKNKGKNSFMLPIWVLLFSLIISTFEYTYPYGPGTSQVMLWFLVGQYMRIEKY